MLTDKQAIEEMAKDIFEPRIAIDGIDIAFAAVHGADMGTDTHFMKIATHLYNKGYRKQSEVAREIFEEIEDILKIVKIPSVNADGCITPLRVGYWAIDPDDYAELKKKYTGGVE